MWLTIFLPATSFCLALASRTPVQAPAHKELAKLKPSANTTASHEVTEEVLECAKHARNARDWLHRADISVGIGQAALIVEDGNSVEAAGRHAKLWGMVAEQEAEVAQQSIQAAKLESSTDVFMARLESQQRDLFNSKDTLLKRVKEIKLQQAEKAQRAREVKASENALAGLRQWPGANEIRIPYEMRRLRDLRDKYAQTVTQLAKNVSDIQKGLKHSEQEVALWEGRKKEVQELGDRLDSTSETLRERKRELYRQDRMLEGLEILLSKDRGDGAGGNLEKKSQQASTTEALARRSSIEKVLGKAQARLGAAHVAVQGLLQKLKASDAEENVKLATTEAMRELSGGNDQVSAGVNALGHVGGETEALSVAKVAILDVQTGFVTAVKHLEKCIPGAVHTPAPSRPIRQTPAASTRSHARTLNSKILSKSKEKHSTSTSLDKPPRSDSQAASGSDSSEPAEMLRRTLHAFRSAAEEASAGSASGSDASLRSASRLTTASRSMDVSGDLQQKIRQLAKEVRAANSLIST